MRRILDRCALLETYSPRGNIIARIWLVLRAFRPSAGCSASMRQSVSYRVQTTVGAGDLGDGLESVDAATAEFPQAELFAVRSSDRRLFYPERSEPVTRVCKVTIHADQATDMLGHVEIARPLGAPSTKIAALRAIVQQ